MKIPETIYLQIKESMPGCEGITWSGDKIYDSDIEYIRRTLFDEKFDRVLELEKEIKKLKSELCRS